MICLSAKLSISRAGVEVYTRTAPKKKIVLGNVALETGTTTKINYVGELYGDNFESDYTDISSNASFSVPIGYLDYFRKGKCVSLKKAWQQDEKFTWNKNMGTAIIGFVTDISYNKDKADIKICGMDKLLEQQAKFTFKKTKRSKIIKKIIETAGLKAKVNVDGLSDKAIDFTNVSESSKSEDSSSALAGGEGADIDSKVKEIVGDETSDYKKMVLIHEWLRKNNNYSYYACSHKDSAAACLKSLKNNCADTARLTRAMMASAGLDAQVVQYYHPSRGHFWTVITIDGKEYASDATSHRRKINDVWNNYKYSKKCGKNPCC